MSQVVFNPENERRRPVSYGRIEMRSDALQLKQRDMVARATVVRRQAEAKERQERLQMLAEEAARAREEILRRKADAKAEAEAARLLALASDMAMPVSSRFERIMKRAIVVFKVTRREIESTRRTDRVVLARQFVMYWAYRLTRLSYPQIGARLGGKDHTTILHGARTYVNKRKAMKRTLRPAR